MLREHYERGRSHQTESMSLFRSDVVPNHPHKNYHPVTQNTYLHNCPQPCSACSCYRKEERMQQATRGDAYKPRSMNMRLQRFGIRNGSIEQILRELKSRRYYTFPGSFEKAAKRAHRLTRQQKWIHKAKQVGSAIDGGSLCEEKTKCLAKALF